MRENIEWLIEQYTETIERLERDAQEQSIGLTYIKSQIRDFQIGDEVRIIGSDPIYDDCDVGWVIRNASEKVKTMYVMRNDGSAGEETKAEWYKTGRHNAMLAEVIKALPPVTQKSGKWIRSLIYENTYNCSKCGSAGYGTFKYCPNCGADMRGAENDEWRSN